jgi:hypothetical protein
MEANFKRYIIMRATEASAKLLVGLMKEFKIANYIETTIVDVSDNQRYKLRIEKVKHKSLIQKIRSCFL